MKSRFVEVARANSRYGTMYFLYEVDVDSPYLRPGDRVALTRGRLARLARPHELSVAELGNVVGVCDGFVADVTRQQALEWAHQRFLERQRR